MKFMLISRLKDSFYALPPKKQKEIMDATGQHAEKLTKEGKLKDFYMLGNMKAALLILDLKSSEDLVHVIQEAPVFPFADAEPTTLVEMDVVRKAQAKK